MGLLMGACRSADCDCAHFQRGTMVSMQRINGKVQQTQIQRFDKWQLETYQNHTDTINIRWVNDCEWVLKAKHPITMAERKGLSMKIVRTQADTAWVRYGYVGQPLQLELKQILKNTK